MAGVRWAGCILLIAVEASGADEGGVTRLDLKASVAQALEAHPDLGPARARLRAADADIQKARAGRFPTGEVIDAFGVAPDARLGEVPPGLPQELAPVLSPSSQFDFSNIVPFNRLEVEVRQPLYTFGKISTGIEAAQAGRVAREAELGRTREDVVLELKRIWWGHKLARESLELTDELVKTFEEALEKAEERLRAGEPGVTQPDVLKLRLALSETKRNRARLKKEVTLSLEGYRRAIGKPPDAPFAPDDGKLTPIEIAELEGLPPVEAVVEQRPAFKAAQAGVLAQEQKVQVERLGYLPDLFVAGIFRWAIAPGRADIDNPFLVDEFNYLVGGAYLGLRAELDPWGVAARVAAEEAKLSEMRAELEAARLGLPLEVRKARLEFDSAKETLELARGARRAGRALALTTVANFGLGIGDADEVLEAVGFFGRADAAWLQAVHDYNLAVAELSRVMGRELDPSLVAR